MTAKVYPDGPVASGALNFTLADAPNASSYWEAIDLFFQQMPSLVLDRNSLQLEIENNTFNVFGITLPDQDVSVLQPLAAPYLTELERLDISYSFGTSPLASFVDYFASIMGPLPYGPYTPNEIWVNRLVPLSVVLEPTANSQLMEAFNGCGRRHLPHWLQRLTAFWDYEATLEENLAVKEKLVSVHTPAIEAATPGSGVYLNEVDPWYRGDWKQ
ncbi:Uu.00g057100.m01.CDS01 [Anthostomella pinea]|uniref:Uu.00g057100.m01.CDS01 n=1 Tax=Anthostomella pinea TaxID=933095 RepID=A0AAI8VRM1_9PEZI|nr:Uu.00g057100.m01.CDS01 [Anthostomella pinea]